MPRTNSADGAAAVTDKIAQLPAFRDVAAGQHETIMQTAPQFQPRLWYGMPGYAKTRLLTELDKPTQTRIAEIVTRALS